MGGTPEIFRLPRSYAVVGPLCNFLVQDQRDELVAVPSTDEGGPRTRL